MVVANEANRDSWAWMRPALISKQENLPKSVDSLSGMTLTKSNAWFARGERKISQ
jgi:hypothetical protein